jgi:hypothetical protein
MACSLQARSAGQRRELTVISGQPDRPAYLPTSRLTRCANRPLSRRSRAGADSNGDSNCNDRRLLVATGGSA